MSRVGRSLELKFRLRSDINFSEKIDLLRDSIFNVNLTLRNDVKFSEKLGTSSRPVFFKKISKRYFMKLRYRMYMKNYRLELSSNVDVKKTNVETSIFEEDNTSEILESFRDSEPSERINFEYGSCCFCGESCNSCSQACGRCVRSGGYSYE